ncbi:glycosyltransferase [Nitritalea halalkaliphila LW7]|uniref:Glycosyltransferase n=1 Tax=Nitritalea halalkaliphila LW7 TaxID=1189621 RepID=I5C606_9BACT|nr:glycosyltransferase [Nitritalea halalkaliphila]EIM77258.1 glycosyltransferase [Nitritalea halalkaliphila LW7]
MHYYYFKRDAVAYVVQTDDVNTRVRKALRTHDVHTVTNNHSSFYLQKNLPQVRKLPKKIPYEFRLLTLTSYYPHKNLELINALIPLLLKKGCTNIKFILTLKETDFQKYMQPHPNLVNVGPLLPQECPALYQECDAMFLPSLAECFSASYPEAMVMRKPIITADLGFARSICGDAALYFTPKDAAAAAEVILQLYADEALQQDLVEKGIKQLPLFDQPKERAQKYLTLAKKYIKKN